ncbi:MAG: prepilin-type N-terminal cleavage/methylation domain-containing protein [Desulfamplus sp.]|nr:prepilin-type N-terminal cleavage/methylation domain-containing protein [Desulfamplus sp.]
MIEKRKPSEKGFTLIEIVIAMLIFTVGLLAVGGMQISAIRGNDQAAGFTEALIVGQSKIEELSLLLYTDPLLNDTAGAYPTVRNSHTGNYDFFIGVTLTPPSPNDNKKEVKLRVQWEQFGTRQIELKTLVLR